MEIFYCCFISIIVALTYGLPENGKKIVFSDLQSADSENLKYEPEPKVGTQEYYESYQWIAVNSDGYEYEGSLASVMAELNEADESDAVPGKEPAMQEDYFEEKNEGPEKEPAMQEDHFEELAISKNQETSDDPANPRKQENFQDPSNPRKQAYFYSYEPVVSNEDEDKSDYAEQSDTLDDDQLEEVDNMEALSQELEFRNKRTLFPPIQRRKVTNFRYPYSTMGYVNSGCTGTFIRRRTILTAAHCVHTGGTAGRWYKFLDFKRRKECTGYCKGIPHTWKWAVTFRGWTAHRLRSKDIAIITVTEPSPVFMQIESRSSFTRGIVNIAGYPGDTRDGCLYATNCYLIKRRLSYRRRIPNRRSKWLFYYKCDLTRGTSGSAIYQYYPLTKKRVVIGVNNFQTSYTNGGTRISSYIRRKLVLWTRRYGGN